MASRSQIQRIVEVARKRRCEVISGILVASENTVMPIKVVTV